MQIVNTKEQLRRLIMPLKNNGKSIGFVPTMGFLHEGHSSLIKLARQNCEIVVVSIFVNPLQFGKNEDLDKYPRDIDSDSLICKNNQVDILYIPEASDILGNNRSPLTYVNIEKLDINLCGAKRPGHFRGVCTIVSKLFNLITPDIAYFGKKDIQQLRIIEQMVADLNFPIQIIGGETYRSPQGLALSSRNSYLSETQKNEALIITQTLQFIAKSITSGINKSEILIEQAQQFIAGAKIPDTAIDYIEIVDNKSLQKVLYINQTVIIAIALYIGKTRLIDNLIYTPNKNTEA